MNDKLTTEEIKYIDNYLQFIGVKFLDVRIELIDHLASDFESKDDVSSLDEFLRNKKSFVQSFEKKLHNKRHWAYQKLLFLRVLKFFYQPKYIGFTLLIGLGIFFATNVENHAIKIFLFFATLIIPQIAQYHIYFKPKGMHKKIQSFRYIFSIMSGPSLFLYCFSALSDWLLSAPLYFTTYWIFAFIFNVSGIFEIRECKKKILSNYNQIISV